MPTESFKWWWDDPKEYHLWKKLNALTPEQREANYGELCKDMVYKYGNIYFYKPHPNQLPIHQDPALFINAHGQNSSGKSYAGGAETAYEATGKNPYREVTQPPFGQRVIWVITTSYQIQRNSSQLILFSNEYAPVKDVGLLPSLKSIEEHGGSVVWEKSRKDKVLKRVELPCHKTVIEFMSMESGSFSLAGAAVDFLWIDEVCPESIYNELVTRILRKSGRGIMTYLVGGKPVNKKVPGEWVVSKLYPEYEQELAKTGKSEMSFYFLVVEDNIALNQEEVKRVKSLVTSEDKEWRFSVGGKFIIQTTGERVFEPYKEELHMREGLTEMYDSFNTIYRAWDLGFRGPACTAFQIDKYNRIRILFSMLGKKEIIQDFVPRVRSHTNDLFKDILGFYELLPHDARRHSDKHPQTTEQIMVDMGLENRQVIYIHAEDDILNFNSYLQKLIKGEPAVLVDSTYAALTCNCMALYTRNEDTGNPIKDNYYEHLADNLKMIGAWLNKEGLITRGNVNMDSTPSEPMYIRESEPRYGER